jgi:hypothetical protein
MSDVVVSVTADTLFAPTKLNPAKLGELTAGKSDHAFTPGVVSGYIDPEPPPFPPSDGYKLIFSIQ